MPRVLVTEDSAVARQLLVGILSQDPDLEVVGQAINGQDAVRLAAELEPDVITMDVHMPVMDGVEATRRIMAETPKPIVMVSADDPNDVRTSFGALEAGALSVLGKPRGPSSPDFPARSQELCRTVKLMAEMRVIRRRRDGTRPRPAAGPPTAGAATARPAAPSAPAIASPTRTAAGLVDLVAIGCSTGGPAALATILRDLPADTPAPVLIVQHITAGFDRGLVDWLNAVSPMRVRLAADGDPLIAGEVLIGPCDSHLSVVRSGRRVTLSDGPPVGGHRPSANVLLESVARTYGRSALGVVLTGMGEDGADGLLALHNTGATTFTQDEASCVVYGMPRAAVERGAAGEVVALAEMAGAIRGVLSRRR